MKDLGRGFIQRDGLEYDTVLQDYEMDSPMPADHGVPDPIEFKSIGLVGKALLNQNYYQEEVLRRLSEIFYRKAETAFCDFEGAGKILKYYGLVPFEVDGDIPNKILQMLVW